MSSEWIQRCLGDLIDIRGGLAYKSEDIDRGDARLLGMGCVSFDKRFLDSGCRRYSGEYKSQHLSFPGDLVIATRQQSENMPILGFPAMIPESLRSEKVIVGTNLYKVENHSEYPNSYLYWLMRGDEYREHVKSRATGSTVRMITKDVVLDFDFYCPSIQESKSIARFLDFFDDKIELNRKTNETLEAMAKALFKSWFVDFDPVRAKAEGRPTGLPAEISDLFPDSFEDSELGEIPSGWSISCVSDICETTDYVANGSFETLKQNVERVDAFSGSEALLLRFTDFNRDWKGDFSFITRESFECDALLPKLISGEIRIPDAEKMLEEVGV
jgi:type I restriction enzyme, S subunit